jgi:galactose mutarotase-like enzyme
MTSQDDSQIREINTPDHSRLTVNPQGGLITLTLHNIPILIPVTRGDGKKISTHTCTPNFGKDFSNYYNLKQHGNMRNELCDTQKIDDSGIVIHHPITDSPGKYPSGIVAKVDLNILANVFNIQITHTNNGATPAPVNCGEHCYFNAPNGYKGVTINNQDVTSLIEQTGSIDLERINLISIPGMPKIELKQSGFTKAVLWVYRNDENIVDTTYVCIEPVEYLPQDFGSPKTMIETNKSRICQFSLKLLD